MSDLEKRVLNKDICDIYPVLQLTIKGWPGWFYVQMDSGLLGLKLKKNLAHNLQKKTPRNCIKWAMFLSLTPNKNLIKNEVERVQNGPRDLRILDIARPQRNSIVAFLGTDLPQLHQTYVSSLKSLPNLWF